MFLVNLAIVFGVLILSGGAIDPDLQDYIRDQSIEDDYETITEILDPLNPGLVDQSYDSLKARDSYESYNIYSHVPSPYVERRASPYQTGPTLKPYPCGTTQSPVDPCEPEGPVVVTDPTDVQIGSLRGRPGIDYPIYTEIPLTSFSCAGRKVPGFYADVETRCQVFHVCYPHRRESFLCPVGTIFNQPILSCDYWYSANCSASSEYFEKDISVQTEEPTEPEVTEEEEIEITTEEQTIPVKPSPPPVFVKPIIQIPQTKPFVLPENPLQQLNPVLALLSQFLPIKAKIVKKVVAPAAIPLAAKAKVALAAAAMKPKIFASIPRIVPMPYKVPVYQPRVVIPVPKAVPVVSLLKGANKVIVKSKLAKPLALKKVVAAKKVKAASIPVISLLTKKHLTAAALKMLQAQHGGSLYGY